jgi:hypothetical protein
MVAVMAVVLAAASPLYSQDAPGAFRWIDFHSPKNQSVIVWVTQALQSAKWTAIREIGVEYDSALVVTTDRETPQSPANADTFTVWNVSLTNHSITPLLKGVNLRWLDWLRFAPGMPQEPGILYDNCSGCAADTYFTTFHYDIPHRQWQARWMQGGQGIHVWSASPPPGVSWTQVFAVMSDDTGRELVGTWTHFDYGSQKPAADFVYRYDLDPWNGLERTQQLTGTMADTMKMRLCRGQDAVTGMERGQNSPLCQQYVNMHYERKPVTTPARNEGRAMPPGARH